MKHLLLNTERVNVTIGELPSEEPIWVFTLGSTKKKEKQKNERRKNTDASSHFGHTHFLIPHQKIYRNG